jgi:hypothetical protein
MPINRELRWFYPINWPEISPVKRRKARHRAQSAHPRGGAGGREDSAETSGHASACRSSTWTRSIGGRAGLRLQRRYLAQRSSVSPDFPPG